MKRRRVVLQAVGIALAGAALPAFPQPPEPSGHKVSARQLQEVLDRRFPLRMGVGGVLSLTLQSPVLRMLPESNRVAADVTVLASGPALARSSSGDFDIDFSLRYERADRTIRAHRLRVRSLRISGLQQPYPELLNGFSAALAQQAVGELILHRPRAEDLALADVMGLEPDTITVTAEGLVIGFTGKQAR